MVNNDSTNHDSSLTPFQKIKIDVELRTGVVKPTTQSSSTTSTSAAVDATLLLADEKKSKIDYTKNQFSKQKEKFSAFQTVIFRPKETVVVKKRSIQPISLVPMEDFEIEGSIIVAAKFQHEQRISPHIVIKVRIL